MSTDTTARQPKGIPVGGQFAATTHSDAVEPLQHPVIENMNFDYNDESFEIECDGDGRYTIYSDDSIGVEIASFSFDGNPADGAGLEAAATKALTEQQTRIGAVSTPGTRVIWTDPDGGQKYHGKVVSAKGEVITVALLHSNEEKVFVDELVIDEAATKLHREAISPTDTPVIWTDPTTGEKVHGRSLGTIGGDNFAFQIPGKRGFGVAKAHELELAPKAAPVPPVKLVETQRRIRGHNFFAPKAIMSKVPALGATENVPLEEKKFHLHYFAGGAANWYIAEVDPATGRAFGLMDPSGRGRGSWGYVDLRELEAVNLGGFRVVERDCYFSQGNLTHVTRNN
ncbi:hypothetical protein GCM10023063_15050 [Arthrobacter methylotrophus]|uniref:DUF2958 domain-containing protein n=1 Tax=Arthrobacter methylotrophus TaxID=121291 RepID=A0ABV5UN26_9MICC